MQWAFYRIPVTGSDQAIELNRFLRTVRVLNCHREFVANGDASFWAMAVEYMPPVEAVPRAGRDAAASKVELLVTKLQLGNGLARQAPLGEQCW